MTRRTAIGIVAGTLLVMLIIGIMFICAKGAATPGGNLYEPQHTIGVEEEDCDKEDKAKGEWWECPSLLKSKAPVVIKTTSQPRVTRTRR